MMRRVGIGGFGNRRIDRTPAPVMVQSMTPRGSLILEHSSLPQGPWSDAEDIPHRAHQHDLHYIVASAHNSLPDCSTLWQHKECTPSARVLQSTELGHTSIHELFPSTTRSDTLPRAGIANNSYHRCLHPHPCTSTNCSHKSSDSTQQCSCPLPTQARDRECSGQSRYDAQTTGLALPPSTKETVPVVLCWKVQALSAVARATRHLVPHLQDVDCH
mmetsp:Transcript_56620/g.123079  ORF Transcript_56620/g.123079 Transcript_56620/m.123079 type:complete len:216 (-) Transcript_56620:285-932(-)